MIAVIHSDGRVLGSWSTIVFIKRTSGQATSQQILDSGQCIGPNFEHDRHHFRVNLHAIERSEGRPDQSPLNRYAHRSHWRLKPGRDWKLLACPWWPMVLDGKWMRGPVVDIWRHVVRNDDTYGNMHRMRR